MIYNIDYKNKALVLLLVVIILFNAFFWSVQVADAFSPAILIPVALCADDLALVSASLLVACGFQFNSDWAARLVGNAFLDCLTPTGLSCIKSIAKKFDSATLNYIRVTLSDYPTLIDGIISFLYDYFDTATSTVTVFNPSFVDSSTILGTFTADSISYSSDITSSEQRKDLSNYTRITADLYIRVVNNASLVSPIVYVACLNSAGNVVYRRLTKTTSSSTSESILERNLEIDTIDFFINENTTCRIKPTYFTDWHYDLTASGSAIYGYKTELADFSNLSKLHYKIEYYDDDVEQWISYPFTQIVSLINSSNSNYIWTEQPTSGIHKNEPISVTVPADVTYFPRGANGSDLFPKVGSSNKPLTDDIPITIPTTIGGVIDFPLADSRPFDVGIDIAGEFDSSATLTQDVVTDDSISSTSFVFDIPILGDILRWIIKIATLIGDIFNLLFDYILSAISNVISSVKEGADNIISGVKEGVNSLTSSIGNVASAVVSGVRSLLIPSDFTWDSFIDELQKIVSPPNSVDFRSYVNATEIPDVTMNYKGSTYVIVDNSFLRKNISSFRGFIGAFLGVLLVIYNYNMFMKLMGYGGLSFNDGRKKGSEDK